MAKAKAVEIGPGKITEIPGHNGDLFRRLTEFFPPEAIEWKPQAMAKDKKKALAVAYVTNRAIMERLDTVVGPDRWKNMFSPGPAGGVICGIAIYLQMIDESWQWIVKWDGAENTDIEAIKGGLSDSMKRAAIQWGIGRYLYRLPSVWVEVDERGRFKQPPTLPPNFIPESSLSPERQKLNAAFQAKGTTYFEDLRGEDWNEKRPAFLQWFVKQRTGNDPGPSPSTNDLPDPLLRQACEWLDKSIQKAKVEDELNYPKGEAYEGDDDIPDEEIY